jgi:hypothetical protein
MFSNNTYRLRTLVYTLVVVFIPLIVISVSLFAPFSQVATAAPSTYLNFQARLRTSSGSIVADGNYNIEFKLYDVSSGGTALWTETRTTGDRVRVVNGYMTANLGSVTAFPGTIQWGEQHWITMNIGGTAVGPVWDGEMNPRLQLTAVPFAFKADSANNVASANTNAASTNSSAVTIQSGNASGATSNSGNITIDTGTATGTTGTISLGAVNSSSLILGRSGLTTLNNGSLTVAQNLLVDTDTLSVDATNNSVGIGLAAPGTTRLVVTNGTTTNQIFSLRDNTSEVLGVANGGAVTFKNETDSVAAFVIQRAASGGTLLTIDTSTVSGSRNGILTVGEVDANATLFVLDTKTTAGDPSGIDGAMYYNSSTNKFRCYENGAWRDCNSFTDTGTETYLTDTADDFVLGGNTPAAGSLFVDVSAGSLRVGNSSLAGSLVVSDGSSNTVTLQTASFGQNTTITIPDPVSASDTICLVIMNNCGSAGNITSTHQAYLNDVATGSSTTAMGLQTFTTATAVSITAVQTEFVAARAGSFRACTLMNATTVTAGTISIRFRKNGADVSTNNYCTLNTTTNRRTSSIISAGVETFNAGDTIGVALIKASYTGSTAHDFSATFTVEYHNTSGGGLVAGDVLNGGQTSGALVLGTDTANSLTLETNNAAIATFSSMGQATFTNSTNSTTAFQIQNSGGTNELFSVDTTNNRVYVGDSTADSTGTTLILDTKNTAGDPTGLNGAMYYNSNTAKFRCYENSVWRDCMVSAGTIDSQTKTANGFSIVGGVIYMQTADDTYPGLVSLSAQSFAGAKTFNDSITVGTTSQSGSVRFYDGSSNTVTIQASGIGTNYALTLPTTAGTTSQCLQTDSVTASQLIFGACTVGGGGSGVTTVGGFDSQSVSNNGAVISGVNIYFQSADGSNPGMVNAGTQTFGGNKTFNGTITVANITPSGNLTIGTSDTTGTLLVLDTKTNAGDPAGVDGGMYYNSNLESFRCYQDGAWQACVNNRVYLTSDVTNNNATACTLADVTGLSFAVTNGVRYHYRAKIWYTAAATTTGSRWTINGPAATVNAYKTDASLTATTGTSQTGASYNAGACSANSATTGGNIATVEGVLTPSADGTLVIRFASEISSSAIVAKAGSYIEYWRE